MYSAKVSFILGAMVLTGAARSVTAKLFFQLGFNHPLFVTLLYLAGQALSLIPYNVMNLLEKRGYNLIWDDHAVLPRLSKKVGDEVPEASTQSHQKDSSSDAHMEEGGGAASLDLDSKKILDQNVKSHGRKSLVRFANENGDSKAEDQDVESPRKSSVRFANENDCVKSEDQDDNSGVEAEGQDAKSHSRKASVRFANEGGRAKAEGQDVKSHGRISSRRKIMNKLSASVSTHGLPVHSRTLHCHNKLPWYLKPAVPALFNLLNSAMRWASLVFVAASVAEMLISGMELVLSVCATRLVRGRKITWIRWVGVSVVTVGIILVGVFDSSSSNAGDGETNDGSTANQQIIGIMLILGQSIMSVIQDLTEEVFMQEAAFPPALLVGMEGAYGIVIAIILYFPIAPLLGENPSDVANSLSRGDVIGLAIGWTLLVTLTGIFNIAATAVTSSMTRNVWKNMRTLLVWVMGLILFYATGSSDLGEGWYIPGSFFILLSYGVMCVGIFIYYGKGARAT